MCRRTSGAPSSESSPPSNLEPTMPLLVNLRHLERQSVVLKGELPVEELDIQTLDALIQMKEPLKYEFEAELMEEELLVRGKLELELECECVRCLKPVAHTVKLEDWACLVPLAGEEAVAREGDFVDLTPLVREDILLAFPQHPLCEPECPGLTQADLGKAKNQSGTAKTECPSVWSTLDKLKL